MSDRVKRICVIGAGAAGLPAIKACLEEGLEVVCYEKTANIGGLWNYRPDLPDDGGMVHKSTISNTSKEISAFSDFPFPKEFPNFIPHKLFYEYFKQYAQRFDLLKHILFEHKVEKVEKNSDYETNHRFKVTVINIKDNSRKYIVFDGVMICTGHNSSLRWPELPGQKTFKGRIMHSRDMPSISQLAEYEDKTALVIGSGNSGFDSAVELSNICDKTYLVLKRGSWVLYRVGQNGLPIDIEVHKRYLNTLQNYLPFSLLCWYFESFYFNQRFNHRLYGIQPKYRCFSQTLVVNEALPSKMLSGKIVAKQTIDRFTADGVIFSDEKTETKCDLVVMATGYNHTLPMIDKSLFETSEEKPLEFYKQVFPKQLPHYSLAVIGAIVPNGGLFPLFEMQSRWYAMLMAGKCQFPSRQQIVTDIEQTIRQRDKIFYKSPRNNSSVDWISYMDDIADMIGVKPDLKQYLFSDTKLFLKLVFGTCLPFQYRLKGNHCWSGARDAIMQSDYRIRYPLNPNEAEIENNFYRIVFLLILFLFVNILLNIL